MAEKQAAEARETQIVEGEVVEDPPVRLVVLDMELLDFDDLPMILEIVAASEDKEVDVTGAQMLHFVQMVRKGITSDTTGLKLTHWRAVMAEFGQAMRQIMNPTDEGTGKN